MTTTGAVVLAAGMSRRFGGDKRAARLPNGSTVAAETLHHLSVAFDAIHVVLRDSDSDAFIESLTIAAPNARFSRCQDAHLGMGHSLAHGVAQVAEWDGLAVCLADMPFIQARTYRQLIEAFKAKAESRAILVPTYRSKRGHPVLFGSEHFRAMQLLQGDEGAKTVLRAQASNVRFVEIDDAAILRDIDQPDDLLSTAERD